MFMWAFLSPCLFLEFQIEWESTLQENPSRQKIVLFVKVIQISLQRVTRAQTFKLTQNFIIMK